jgi:hypothetical protein
MVTQFLHNTVTMMKRRTLALATAAFAATAFAPWPKPLAPNNSPSA